MITYQEALAKILEQAAPLPQKRLKLEGLLGHVLAQPVTAKFPLPLFDNSAVDGYGVLCSDVAGASESGTARLELIGEIQAGSGNEFNISTGTAVKILTGARVPASVEAVVMREFCEEHYGYLHVSTPADPGDNIRRIGAEFKAGEEVLRSGVRVTPPVIGLLASLGYSSFMVHGKPRVAIVTTGDELVQPGHPLAAGQIYDSNSYALQAAVSSLGIEEWFTHHAVDTRKSTRNAFKYAIEQADVIISSGGVSVGDHDYVKEILEEMGVETVFWRVAVKPGKPVYFGILELPRRKLKKLIFGLPGNPVSVLVSYHQFVKPALLKCMGLVQPGPRNFSAKLSQTLKKRPGRLDLVRGTLGVRESGHLIVKPTLGQESHMLGGLALADCLIHFDKEADILPEGSDALINMLSWNE